jgi:hypothetical protein
MARKVSRDHWSNHWTVDEVIECLPIKGTTESALMLAMPNAYDRPEAGEDDFPEPYPGTETELYTLAKVWPELSKDVKKDLGAAYRKEFGN